MYRVVTDGKDYKGRRVLDRGPWLMSQNEVEFWADFLRSVGYKVMVEKLQGNVSGHLSR